MYFLAFAVAPKLGPDGPAVLEAARRAFVDGWRLSMWIAAAIALAAAAFTGIWIPRLRPVTPAAADTDTDGVAVEAFELVSGS